MLCVVFGLSLLDRTNISAAYIAGLSSDVALNVGARYNIALLVFFIGYALFELPSNMVIRRLGARLWLSFLIISWGACVLGMGFVHSWVSLTVCRALLGMFEAGLFPGAVFIIGSWYRQYETAKRVSLFYMAALLASGFGPILAYALSLIRVGNGTYRQGWRWIFIIEGIATIVAGIISPFFLVEFPEKAKWLTPRQRNIAICRMQIDKEARQFVHPTFKESMRMLWDWKLAVYSMQYFVAASSVYSLSYFQPIILREGMGFSYALAQILSSPCYVFAIIMSMAMAWVSDKYRTRWTVLCFQSLSAVAGLLVILYAKPPGVRYLGLYLATFGTQANVPGTLSYGQSQTAKIERKGVIAAAMISIGAAGGITGSTIFRTQDAPQYLPGMWATIAMQLFYTLVTVCMSLYLKRQNRLADEGKGPALEGIEGFRYAP
ncbi:retrograde regulation protein 2 [Pseudovirgaria hyperparasitica]|uniref:Retrograde regulation protein 2 n=1 Tax=Pseudovirgaria hyperparasitica TaxID=470096 RepID=A0A6A6VTH3_9PEZI|nr:retrograde regulation protein 2 [Pseudovirgaria hyperparasitica]KAF2753513.1 retrograde regulation protein 2 [Pseudovirgaria hyperparasitica]